MVWKKLLHLQIHGFLTKTKIIVEIFQNISEPPSTTQKISKKYTKFITNITWRPLQYHFNDNHLLQCFTDVANESKNVISCGKMTTSSQWLPIFHSSWSFTIKIPYFLCTLTLKNWSLAKTLGLNCDMTGSLSSMQVNSKVFINNLLGTAYFCKQKQDCRNSRKV